MHQRFQEPPQQFFQIARFQLDAEQLVKRLRFRFADLIIGVVQRQNDAKMQLLADPLKVGVLVRQQRHQQRRQQLIVFLQRFQNRAGRQIQLGQTASVILHLLDEMQRSFPLRQNARRRSRRDLRQRRSLLGLKRQRAQAAQELAVDLIRVRFQQHRQPVQMHA